MKRILVIDGNSIINRAYYGVHSLSTKSGKPTNAIYGMINIINRHLGAISPDYAAVAFDLKKPTFRKKIYDEYKAGRRETPADLLEQFDDAKECLKYMGFNILTLEGYEADDILGTVASFAESAEDTVSYILSGDRDLFQLISDKITVLWATNNDTVHYTRKEFSDKYGITPEQFVDLKALMGDSSDNIPGVAGIGEKTGIRLISEFGTLDNLYENLNSPSISPSVRTKLESNRDNAYLSRELARIVRDAPIGKTLDELKYTGIDNDRLYAKFTELEFSNVIRKMNLHVPAADISDMMAKPQPKIEISDGKYVFASAAEILSAVGKTVAIDYGNNGFYISDGERNYTLNGKIEELSSLFGGEYEIVCYDSKALYHMLSSHGIRMTAVPKDIMLESYVLDSSKGMRNIFAIASSVIGVSVDEVHPVSHLMIPVSDSLCEKISETGCLDLLEKVELPLAAVLAKMEETGFKVDCDGLMEFGEMLKEESAKTEKRIFELAGEEFNISSPKQLGEVLFEKLKLPHNKKTKSGYSTSAEVLTSLCGDYPIAALILDYRQLTKLYSTYVLGLTRAADENGRIHTDFKQSLTSTGRLSSAEPNLQNIPIRTPLGRHMRKFFVAEDGNILVDADYSQIELRLLAALSGDENMINAFRRGEDIHASTAAAVFHVPPEEVTDELRKRAKAVNFGIVYGIGAFSLAADIKTSVAEARAYIESYFRNYPKIDQYLKGVINDAIEKKYTTTVLGRRRYIGELSSTNRMLLNLGKRLAMNSPIQGSAADIIKIAMVNVENRLEKELPSAKLIMQVHDELIIECRKEDSDTAKKILREEMENAVHLPVPLEVEITCGENWLEAH